MTKLVARRQRYVVTESDTMPLRMIDVRVEFADGTSHTFRTQARHLISAVSTARGTAERELSARQLGSIVAITTA